MPPTTPVMLKVELASHVAVGIVTDVVPIIQKAPLENKRLDVELVFAFDVDDKSNLPVIAAVVFVKFKVPVADVDVFSVPAIVDVVVPVNASPIFCVPPKFKVEPACTVKSTPLNPAMVNVVPAADCKIAFALFITFNCPIVCAAGNDVIVGVAVIDPSIINTSFAKGVVRVGVQFVEVVQAAVPV